MLNIIYYFDSVVKTSLKQNLVKKKINNFNLDFSKVCLKLWCKLFSNASVSQILRVYDPAF